jgi:hypothetical protein
VHPKERVCPYCADELHADLRKVPGAAHDDQAVNCRPTYAFVTWELEAADFDSNCATEAEEGSCKLAAEAPRACSGNSFGCETFHKTRVP